MYTFINSENIKQKFDDKRLKKIRLKKRDLTNKSVLFNKETLVNKKKSVYRNKKKEKEKKEDEDEDEDTEEEDHDKEKHDDNEDDEDELQEDDDKDEDDNDDDEDELHEDEDKDDDDNEDDEDEDELQEDDDKDEEQEKEDQLNNNTIYEYDGKKYTIDNEKFLQKRFDDIRENMTYKINICIYKCVRNGYLPYLLYLSTYDEKYKTYVLPNDYVIQINNESVDEIEENIMNIFKEALFNIYPPNKFESSNESTDLYNEELFKGFFLHEKEITMVFDATRINVPLESNKYCWINPYEIFVSKKMKSIPISKTVSKIFDEISATSSNSVDFYHLKQVSNDTIVKTPYILFMCIQSESSNSGFVLVDIFNTKKIIYSSIESSETETETETVLYPTVQHPSIGDYTMFSSSPFSISNLIKRFAVFIDTDTLHPLYIEPEKNDLLTSLYDVDNQQYTSITFIENEKQLWCIKSYEFFTEIPDNGNYLLENENIPPSIIEQGDIEKDAKSTTEPTTKEIKEPNANDNKIIK